MSKAYLLTWEDSYKNVKVESFDTKTEAGEASFKSNAPHKLMVGGTSDLMGKSLQELVDLYNGLNGTMLVRFRDLNSGQERLLASIKGVVAADNVNNDTTQGEGEPVAAKTKKKAASTGTKKTYTRLDPDKKIRLLAEGNPRREGTAGHKSYSLLTSGMKVSTALEKGARRVDLKWDIAHGNIELTD
jgi:hypothetical protein